MSLYERFKEANWNDFLDEYIPKTKEQQEKFLLPFGPPDTTECEVLAYLHDNLGAVGKEQTIEELSERRAKDLSEKVKESQGVKINPDLNSYRDRVKSDIRHAKEFGYIEYRTENGEDIIELTRFGELVVKVMDKAL